MSTAASLFFRLMQSLSSFGLALRSSIGETDAAAIKVETGSGAPTHTAVQGSLYIQRDAASTEAHLWRNTDGGTTWISRKLFSSTIQTGTGSAQNIAHGLGAVPSQVWWSVGDAGAGLTAGPPPVLSFVPGTHTSTNVVMTVSTGVTFYVFAQI